MMDKEELEYFKRKIKMVYSTLRPHNKTMQYFISNDRFIEEFLHLWDSRREYDKDVYLKKWWNLAKDLGYMWDLQAFIELYDYLDVWQPDPLDSIDLFIKLVDVDY